MTFFTNNKSVTKSLVLFATFFLMFFANIYSQHITPLDSVKTNDSDGLSIMAQAPSINVTGIVTALQELGTGTAGPGTIQNNETGVAVYGNFFAKDGGLQIGDSVLVLDVKVSPYYGLTELSYNSTSSVQIISRNHVVKPAVVKISDVSQGWNGFEKYESMFVQFSNVTFIDTEKTFYLNRTSSSGKKYGKYRFTDGTDTLTFYFTPNCPSIVGVAVPKAAANVTGILSQSCSTAPYSTGYEIIPLGSSSISLATAVNSQPEIPSTFELSQNYPNPFNPTTTINFSVPSAQKVQLVVYDLLGRVVSTLYNSIAPAGVTSVRFNASKLASGVYIYSLKTVNTVMSKKLMLMK